MSKKGNISFTVPTNYYDPPLHIFSLSKEKSHKENNNEIFSLEEL